MDYGTILYVGPGYKVWGVSSDYYSAICGEGRYNRLKAPLELWVQRKLRLVDNNSRAGFRIVKTVNDEE